MKKKNSDNTKLAIGMHLNHAISLNNQSVECGICKGSQCKELLITWKKNQ